ncbi:hypothetical protein KSP39_PZI019644 [Platanthera zijinensis]|uniref:Retrotransposon gag domain-containing protein n=1 Tax=Platanthera zijinensis TaxID=2320716 RepID=A0AAP0FYD8_9ASPA
MKKKEERGYEGLVEAAAAISSRHEAIEQQSIVIEALNKAFPPVIFSMATDKEPSSPIKIFTRAFCELHDNIFPLVGGPLQDFEDQSCEIIFGQIPPADDQALKQPCYQTSCEEAPVRRAWKEVVVEEGERAYQGECCFSAHWTLDAKEIARAPSTRQAGTGSLFCELVLSAPVPEGFGDSFMSYYTRKDDPIQHLQWFEDTVSIRQVTNAFKCRLFVITFNGKARDWFHQLLSSTIYNFDDSCRSYLLRFSTSKRKKVVNALFLIK